jgi:hypothetical protein
MLKSKRTPATIRAIALCGVVAALLGSHAAFAALAGLTGWNDANVYNGVAQDLDVNGEIGHPLTVRQPVANCYVGNRVNNQLWNVNALPTLASGVLPPGLSLPTTLPLNISGIPTARGHWIVKLNFSGSTCNGESHEGFTQVLRFHITGSGQVVQ